MGSPTGVPVPCASTIPTLHGSTSAAVSAVVYTARCADMDGVAMLTVCPSWLAAVPRITARTRSPSRRASASRLSMRTAEPSAETNPSAATSNARHRPVADSMPCADPDTILRGSSSSDTPPTSAVSLSPSSRLRQARWTASKPDEQAASTV